MPEARPHSGAFHADNPARRLEQAFGRIAAERMAGLALCNPVLQVAVVDMADHEGEWLGGLVTPWALSLVILPGPGGRFRPIAVGESQTWAFASGAYPFLGNDEPGLGHYQSCSLFSPAFEVADQAAAEAVVRAARAALIDAATADAASVEAAEAARLEGRPLSERLVSRRAFLRGGMFGARG